MTYSINKSDGSLLVDLVDHAVNRTATDLILIGKNVTGYGEYINENFVRLLENFASIEEPSNPIVGQIWFDTGKNRLTVYDGNGFSEASGPIVSSTPPASPKQGDLWINSEDNQIFFYDGVDRTLAGPVFKARQGMSGFEVADIYDQSGNLRVITKLWSAGALLGIFSNHSEFTPNPGINGYTGTIKTGFNPAEVDGFKIHTVVSAADALLAQDGAQKAVEDFVLKQGDNTISGSVFINDAAPLTLGLAQNTDFLVNEDLFEIRNNIIEQDFVLTVRPLTEITKTAIRVNAADQRMGVFNNAPEATLHVGTTQAPGSVIIEGDLTVKGNTLTIESTDLVIADKHVVLAASGTSESHANSDGGGLILKGQNGVDHTMLWNYDSENLAASKWTLSENLNLVAEKSYQINGVPVLTSNSLGSGITTASGLTSIGQLTNLRVGNFTINGSSITVSSGNLDIYLPSQAVVNMRQSRMTNLPNPVADSDASTRKYVDSRISSVFGSNWREVSGQVMSAASDQLLVNTLPGPAFVVLPESPQIGDAVKFLDLSGTFNQLNSALTVVRYRTVTTSGLAGTASNSTGNYANLPTTQGSGTGLTVTVLVKTSGVAYSSTSVQITVVNHGVGYKNGDRIRVSGALLGGVALTNDLEFEILVPRLLGKDDDLLVTDPNAGFTLVYVGSTQGWVYRETTVIPDNITATLDGNVNGALFGNMIGGSVSSPTSLTVASGTGTLLVRGGTSNVKITTLSQTGARELTSISVESAPTTTTQPVTRLYGHVVVDNENFESSNGSTFMLPRYTDVQLAARTITSLNNGEMIYNSTLNKVQVCANGVWVSLNN